MNANEKQPVAPGKQNETSEMIREPISNSMTISNEAVEAAEQLESDLDAAQQNECRCGSIDGERGCPWCDAMSALYKTFPSRFQSAITRVCAEKDRQLAVMKEALEKISGQCNNRFESTVTIMADIADAALSSFPAAATKQDLGEP